ncbi:MAG: septum formation initiator family protein [Candidatus Paceibacterota bacterium]|jgi:cell division protein FtsB
MIEFQDKKKIRKILYSRPVLILGAAILMYLSFAAYSMYQKAAETGGNREMALLEQAALEAKQNQLEEQISRLKTTRGVEEEIRKKFRVVKGGESVIIVVDDKTDGQGAAASLSGLTPFFEMIKSWFK